MGVFLILLVVYVLLGFVTRGIDERKEREEAKEHRQFIQQYLKKKKEEEEQEEVKKWKPF